MNKQAEYVDHMGSDLTVVNSARVSFDKHHDILTEGDEKLIAYLVKHNHWTPLAHPMITMRETVPIFVARQRFKHMVGFVYNEVSRRYVDDTPEFHIPEVWRSRPEGGMKQGSGALEVKHLQTDLCGGGLPIMVDIHGEYSTLLAAAQDLYERMIAAGVAPEQARMVLPQSMMTSYYVTGSLAAWARAYKQRADSHAQLEIQNLAKDWNDVIAPLFPVAWQAIIGA